MKKIYKNKLKLFFLIIVLLTILSIVLFRKSFSSFDANSSVNVDINTAVYIFKEEEFNFNIDLDKLSPRDEPYIYAFSVANYNLEKRSDVDIEYELSLVTTTNLPLRYELYRNETYSADADNIITSDQIVSDSDGTWYRNLNITGKYNMYHNIDTKDVYYLVVYFPRAYSNTISYEGVIDNVEISIKSKQIVG